MWAVTPEKSIRPPWGCPKRVEGSKPTAGEGNRQPRNLLRGHGATEHFPSTVSTVRGAPPQAAVAKTVETVRMGYAVRRPPQ